MRTPLHKYRAARYAALAAVAATLAWSTATVRAGDDDQRIQFAPGTDQGSVSGTFSEGAVDNFVLRAGAGQTMFVSVAPSEGGASVAVYDPNGTKIAEPPDPAPASASRCRRPATTRSPSVQAVPRSPRTP